MRSDEVAQGFVQLGLENLKGCQLLNHSLSLLMGENVLLFCLYSGLEPLLFQLLLTVSPPPTLHHCEELASTLLITFS